jgi:hypothetical protein
MVRATFTEISYEREDGGAATMCRRTLFLRLIQAVLGPHPKNAMPPPGFQLNGLKDGETAAGSSLALARARNLAWRQGSFLPQCYDSDAGPVDRLDARRTPGWDAWVPGLIWWRGGPAKPHDAVGKALRDSMQLRWRCSTAQHCGGLEAFTTATTPAPFLIL